MSFDSIYKLSVILSVVDKISQPMGQVGKNINNSISGLDKASAVFGGMTQTGLLMAGAGQQIAQGISSPVKATFETKRAISELSSLGVEKLEMMEGAAKSFSDTWAGTTKADFITAAYDIKSGIASLSDEGVAGYTEMAGITAVATKSTIDTMTSLFATGYGIYKDFYSDLSDEQFGELFSAGISQSVKQFKTDGGEMAAAIQTLGASATNAQVPLEEQLSVLGMLQATMSGSEAGTKYNAFLRSAAKGGEELGISFLDANNQLLSMPEIMDRLHSVFGDTIDAAEKMELQQAFGDSEAVKLIDLMYNKTGDLQNNILSLYDTMGQGKSATLEMADAINSSDPAQFDKISQSAHNLAESVGNAVMPKVREYAAKIPEIIEKAEAWVGNNQELVQVIFMVLAGLGLFLISGGAVITVIGGIGSIVTKSIKSFDMLKDGVKRAGKGFDDALPKIKACGVGTLNFARQSIASAAAALPGLIASVRSFTAALLANPITWIVIGIIALVAGIVLLYNKCEWFRNLVNNLGAAIREKLGAAFDFMKNVVGGIARTIGNSLNTAKDMVGENLNNMQQAYEAHGGGVKGITAAAVEGVKGAYTAGFAFLDNLTGGKLTEIKDKFSEKLGPVKDVVDNIMGAARDTAVEKLNNMKQAYETHGGGIKGVAAAAIEGVKGAYTAGFTFIDNLTGGKLSAITAKFGQGIQNIKNGITNSIAWFRSSGQKIMDTFTEGIEAALSKPIEAVKGGLQKIRNMLPFSDAKEGPLNALTLSGTKVMSTLSTGIQQAEHLPAEAVATGFEKIDLAPQMNAGQDKKTDGKKDNTVSAAEAEAGDRNRRTIIEKLIIQADLKTIKDLQALLRLAEEIEDYVHSNNDDNLVPEPA